MASLSTDSKIKSNRQEQTEQQIKEDMNYCVNIVRERDREGFLCGLLMPQQAQRSYFAIRAFNVELASIKDSHSLRRREQTLSNRETASTMVLRMRMQWWRDALAQIYGDENLTPNNISISCWSSPIVRALDRVQSSTELTRSFLERLIDAREDDLEVYQYVTVQQTIDYAEQSASSLLYLSLECCGVREDAADLVASHAGVGIGLVTALRATPFRLLHGELPIPGELFPPSFAHRDLVEWRLHMDDGQDFALTEQDTKALHDAVKHIAYLASSHLTQAREMQTKVPRTGRVALLPVVPAMHYLGQLQKADFNLFDQNLGKNWSRLNVMLLLGRTWLTGIF